MAADNPLSQSQPLLSPREDKPNPRPPPLPRERDRDQDTTNWTPAWSSGRLNRSKGHGSKRGTKGSAGGQQPHTNTATNRYSDLKDDGTSLTLVEGRSTARGSSPFIAEPQSQDSTTSMPPIDDGRIRGLLDVHCAATTTAIGVIREDLFTELQESLSKGLAELSKSIQASVSTTAKTHTQITALLGTTINKGVALKAAVWESNAKQEAILEALCATNAKTNTVIEAITINSELVTSLSKRFWSISQATHLGTGSRAGTPAASFRPISVAATCETPADIDRVMSPVVDHSTTSDKQPITPPLAPHPQQSNLDRLVMASTTDGRARTYWLAQNTPAPMTGIGATNMRHSPLPLCPSPMDTRGTPASTHRGNKPYKCRPFGTENTRPPQMLLKSHGFTTYCETCGGAIMSPCHVDRCRVAHQNKKSSCNIEGLVTLKYHSKDKGCVCVSGLRL
jgi:hypothetical protein